MNESQLKEMARLIKEGFTSGRLDDEDGTHVYFDLKTEIWKD